ncbi:glycosyltransferase family 4 protein [Leptolyngbya sp. 7M]|uniref:glycosyltransferase family 4 protein n=1 Tax=Leptolyngbya sp. 7M TaxID=2812896 RepID=UPI001CEDC11F|nr:glycosyltransferase family 4 protein [Leptolyngbya sp. 7M]
MKPKILLFSTLSPYPFWAGSEKYWFDLVTDPRTCKRFEFHIRLAYSPVTQHKATELEAAGAKVQFYRHHNIHFVRRNLAKLRDRLTGSAVRRLPWYDEIIRGDWDLVWLNVDGFANFRELEYPVRICESKKIPYWLMLQHANEDFYLDSHECLQTYTYIAETAKRFVFVAERNRTSFERAICRKLTNYLLTRNGLTSEALEEAKNISISFPVKSERKVRFLNLGRFSPLDKGQHLILESLSSEKWKGRDWQLSFVGLSEFGREYLKNLSSYFGLESKRIDVVPFLHNVFEIIANNDILLMPSLSEGTPFAMIEAMACGRPAVGTPVGGIPELIIDGKTGWLAKTTHVSDISEAMERMWQDRKSWAAIGKNASDHVASENNYDTLFTTILDNLEADTER